jgi:ABC-type multidrug transport system ATPase subunit
VIRPGVQRIAEVADPPRQDTSNKRPVLELADVQFSFRANRVPILRGVSLSLPPGTVAWVGGRNGAGKTTLLRVAAGILFPHAGSVRLCGLDPVKDRRAFHRRLGFTSAGDRGLHARMTVAQHLDYWARLAYVPSAERQRRVVQGIAGFELDELANRRVDRLSMGQRQRVRLLMALLHEPTVILLDEPRNSLDEDGYRVLNEQVGAAAARGAAVLWCSPHGEDHVLSFDASYELRDGMLERTG